MRKGTVCGIRLSMKPDQFYHDNDQLALYKCSIVSILGLYQRIDINIQRIHLTIIPITSYIRQTRIPNGPFFSELVTLFINATLHGLLTTSD